MQYLLLSLSVTYTQSTISYLKINDCYSSHSKLTLNKNLRTFTVSLTSTGNSECQVFPQDISANLTVFSSVFPDVMSIVATNFTYKNTNELLFKIPATNGADYDLSTYQDEHFSILQIFSYTEVTEIQLSVYDELKSDLQNCFQSLDVEFVSSQIKAHICPSISCKAQMVLQATNPKAYVTEARIQLNSFQYILSLNDFITAYAASSCYTTILPTTATEMMAILTNSFIKAVLQISSKQGQVNVVLKYDSQVTTNELSASFTRKEVFLYDESGSKGFQVRLEYDSVKLAALKTSVQALDYDSVAYRLTSKVGKTESEMIIQKSQFDFARTVDFSCASGSALQQNKCAALIKADFAGSNSAVYNFEVIFYKQSTAVMILKAPQLTVLYTCWSGGSATLDGKTLNIELNSNYMCTQSAISTVSLEIFNSTSQSVSVQSQQALSNLSKFSFVLTQTSISHLLFKLSSTFTFQIQINKVHEQNKQAVLLGGIITGVICAVFVAVLALIKIVFTFKNIKQIKKNKKNK
ncbi:Conserved_hypothetical protein [Hexamita inflata]|uniref:Transmembrane protein n=1 Tax=Hexamita inflata TaxID=28002 RepID=A0AA86PF84_9EUKA|nr:Conserved hypothetical protein [Hexamita inflata]